MPEAPRGTVPVPLLVPLLVPGTVPQLKPPVALTLLLVHPNVTPANRRGHQRPTETTY